MCGTTKKEYTLRERKEVSTNERIKYTDGGTKWKKRNRSCATITSNGNPVIGATEPA